MWDRIERFKYIAEDKGNFHFIIGRFSDSIA
jgi:hypothetical protein